MTRVLVTDATSTLGAALVRRLLRDPQYEVRACVEGPAPQWLRESCEIHAGDMRDVAQARAALDGCPLAVQLAPPADPARPHTVLERQLGLAGALVHAAVEHGVERLTYVSALAAHDAGEALCRAAHAEHGLPFTICRPRDVYGARTAQTADPGVVGEAIGQSLAARRPLRLGAPAAQLCTPTHADDVAEGIVLATAATAARSERFELAGAEQLTVAELARIAWEACGNDPAELELAEPRAAPDATVERALAMPGWEPRIGLREGIAQTVAWLREHAPPTEPALA